MPSAEEPVPRKAALGRMADPSRYTGSSIAAPSQLPKSTSGVHAGMMTRAISMTNLPDWATGCITGAELGIADFFEIRTHPPNRNRE